MSEFDSEKDYYRILSVSEDATAEEIYRQYRLQANAHHPDHGGDEEEMKAINEAYAVLGDEEKRESYDESRGIERFNVSRTAAYSASRGGGLSVESISASSGDAFGLFIGALICLGVGLPMLMLVEAQWVFFLWPLRILSWGVILIGLLLTRSAFRHKHREMMKARGNFSRLREIAGDLIFWLVALVSASLFYFILHEAAR